MYSALWSRSNDRLKSFSAKPILKSAAKLSAPRLSLGFRGWNYITISITFNPAALPFFTDHNSSIYPDTGCKITLVYRDWLAKKLFSSKINRMTISLNVKGIGASKYKSKNFILTTVYIPSFDGNVREVYTSIIYKLHLLTDWKQIC